MARRIQLRRDTAANWSSTNPTLAQGEIGIDLTNNKIKIGTGSTAWNALSYFDDKETSLSNYAGHIVPSTDNTYDLGAPDKQWRDIFVSEGSIYIGDLKLSNDSGTLLVQRVTDAGLVTEEPVPGTPGAVTTDRLVNGANTFVLLDNGTVELNSEPFTVGNVNTGNIGFDQSNIYNTAGGGLILSNLNYLTDEAETAYINIPPGNSDNNLSIVQEQGSVSINSSGNTWNFGGEEPEGLYWPDGTFQATAFVGTANSVYREGGVTITATNPQLATLEQDYDERRIILEDTFTALSEEVGYPWGITLPVSHTTYDELVAANDGSLPGSIIPIVAIAQQTRNAYIAWQQALTDTSIIITANGNSWEFDHNGNLYADNDIITSAGRFVQDCSDGTTSMRWVNADDGGDDQQLIRVYSDGGEPYTEPGNEENERVQVGYKEIDPGVSSFYIEATSNANGLTTDEDDDRRWEFQGTGDLKLPNNTVIASDVDVTEIQSPLPFNIETTGPAKIITDSTNDGHQWEFGDDGNLTLPANGDILDSNGNSVLGAGVPTIPNTRRGFINLVGDRPNDEDDIFFESVVVRGNYAYVAGGDYYINNLGHGNYDPDEPKIYKFDLTTGEQIWVKQITAGRGAEFIISVGEGQIIIDSIDDPGQGYLQGEEIPFQGWQISGGNSPTNNFVIIADTVGEGGQILTASVKPGYDVGALNQLSFTVSTPFSGATSNEGLSITYDDFNNKLVITAEFRSGQGDQEDNNWDWTNVYVMDPTSGIINQTVTLSSDSDVYSASVKTYNKAGGVAVVGEKFNEKRAFGNLVFITGYNGYFDILKSNLDAEHYPGSIIPGDDYYNFYVTGTGITNREYVDNVNYYTQLPTTTPGGGSGATFYTNYNYNTGITTFNIDANGIGYQIGDILTIAGTNFANGASPANDVEIEVTNIDGAGGVIAMEVLVDDIPTDALRIKVDGVDFSGVGTWSLFQNLGGEAFLWTPTWSRAIGGGNSDRFYDVAWSADGNSLYAVGRGRYETAYDQALVVKFNATTGSIIWSKDIKFSEATTNNREARAVIAIPETTDILVAGGWYNNNINVNELILTRMTSAGAAVWQKTYMVNYDGDNFYLNFEINLKAIEGGIVATFEHNTNDSDGMATLIIDATDGTVIKHRVISSEGNDNRFYYNDPNANFADVYIDNDGAHIVMAGYTYVPTDNYYNALLIKLPLDGVKDIAVGERLSIGEHTLNRYNVSVTTVTSAFDDFTATEHVNTITPILNNKGYVTRTPDGLLNVWTYTITDDTLGFLEFGDGSKQSFATNVIPQIPAANDYYLTPQDSGKHIFFEHENGWVYIPHRDLVQFPVGFTFTVVNTTGSDCYVRTNTGPDGELRARLKLAGRNIDTYRIGIPDSGSGSMVTFLKIKDGYYMQNGDGDNDYPDVWIVSGPGDVYDDD